MIQFDEKGEIDKVESELTTRYAGLIDEIANATRKIESLEEKLKTGVGEWAELIDSFDFTAGTAGLKNIDLIFKTSSHPLLSTLKKINHFSQAHANQLGEGNLFNQEGNQRKNREALELLKQLHIHLKNHLETILPSTWLFDLEIMVTAENGEFPMGKGESKQFSLGQERLLDCILRMSLLKLIILKSDSNGNSPVQCFLDNVNEQDSAQLSAIAKWLKTLDIQLISASVDPPSMMNIDQGYRLTQTSKAQIRAYQIFSKVG